MRSLLKFAFLAFFLCSNLFSSDSEGIDFIKKHYSNCTNNGYFIKPSYASSVSQIQPEYLQDDYIQIGNDVFKIGKTDYMCFNVSFLNDSGYFLADYGNKQGFGLFNYSPDFSSTKISCIINPDGKVNKCGPFSSEEDKIRARDVEFSYYTETSLSKVKTCQPGENFNTNTKQCQSCPAGQSWDPETNTCFNDCRKDGKINKFAFTDGSCIDCSGEKDPLSVLKCFCLGSGFGFGGASSFWGKNGGSPDGCDLQGACLDGSQISFTNPNCKPDDNPDPKPDPKPDDNKTKPDDPKPDNSDNPQPNPGGGSGGGNGGGGGGNGGGKEDKPSPNPGTGDNPEGKPNPNPNPGGGSGGGGNGNNKDSEAKFNKGDFDDGDLEKERNSLYNGIVKHINDNLSKFDGIREGVDQFLKNVQGKGFETVKTSIKSKCPMKKEIPLPNGGSKDITVDLCEYVSPASEISYYAFYVGFAVGGFLLFLKLLIFSF